MNHLIYIYAAEDRQRSPAVCYVPGSRCKSSVFVSGNLFRTSVSQASGFTPCSLLVPTRAGLLSYLLCSVIFCCHWLRFALPNVVSEWNEGSPPIKEMFASPSLRRFAIHSVQHDKEDIRIQNLTALPTRE